MSFITNCGRGKISELFITESERQFGNCNDDYGQYAIERYEFCVVSVSRLRDHIELTATSKRALSTTTTSRFLSPTQTRTLFDSRRHQVTGSIVLNRPDWSPRGICKQYIDACAN